MEIVDEIGRHCPEGCCVMFGTQGVGEPVEQLFAHGL